MIENMGPDEHDHYSDLLPELPGEPADDEHYIGPMPEDRDADTAEMYQPPNTHGEDDSDVSLSDSWRPGLIEELPDAYMELPDDGDYIGHMLEK